MADLALLKAEVDAADTRARLARQRYNNALIEASGIKVDDVIEARFYSNGEFEPVIVRGVKVSHGTVRATVSVKTKAGWSKAIRDASLIRVNGEERRNW